MVLLNTHYLYMYVWTLYSKVFYLYSYFFLILKSEIIHADLNEIVIMQI